jgi:hypothetical protein
MIYLNSTIDCTVISIRLPCPLLYYKAHGVGVVESLLTLRGALRLASCQLTNLPQAPAIDCFSHLGQLAFDNSALRHHPQSAMDFLKSLLPEGKGVLPYYMLVVCSRTPPS